MASDAVTKEKTGKLANIYIGILLVIFGGIVLHAPLTVGLGTLWPDYNLIIKAWKEVLMLVAGIIMLVLLYKKRRFNLLKDPIILAIIIYSTLHLVLIPLFYTKIAPVLAGLAIDLRYVAFFGLVYIALKLYPSYVKTFLKVGIAGALIVLIFAILQVFVLPNDILKYLGYNLNTIVPYLTVDLNPDYIRINSTLRGPNPVGAYAVITLAILAAAVVKNKIKRERWPMITASVLAVGGLVALWYSYSRSALVAAIIAVGLVLAATVARRLPRWAWITTATVVVAMAGGLIAARDTPFVSNVILHVNQDGGSVATSNEGHIESLQQGTELMLMQPFGAGIGSAGSASLLGDNGLIIENQYLFIAHEVGWLGLILFVSIFIAILIKLWQRRSNWLALGVFAGGIGMAIIGLLLPVWVDDTTAIIWWGLAAIALNYKPESGVQ